MTSTTEKIIMAVVGLGCKIVFHLLAFIIAFLYNYKVGLVFVGIFVFHQLVSYWFMRGKKIDCKILIK